MTLGPRETEAMLSPSGNPGVRIRIVEPGFLEVVVSIIVQGEVLMEKH
jgi:hypothetical protein